MRIAAGTSDPFRPGVEVLAKALPEAVSEFPKGCHTGQFVLEQEPPSLALLSRHLGAP